MEDSDRFRETLTMCLPYAKPPECRMLNARVDALAGGIDRHRSQDVIGQTLTA